MVPLPSDFQNISSISFLYLTHKPTKADCRTLSKYSHAFFSFLPSFLPLSFFSSWSLSCLNLSIQTLWRIKLNPFNLIRRFNYYRFSFMAYFDDTSNNWKKQFPYPFVYSQLCKRTPLWGGRTYTASHDRILLVCLSLNSLKCRHLELVPRVSALDGVDCKAELAEDDETWKTGTQLRTPVPSNFNNIMGDKIAFC